MTEDTSRASGETGRWRALGILAVACLLGMTCWFSASAVLPQLKHEWGLSPAAGAALTIAVQVGFVAGALISAILNVPDLLPPRRLMFLGCLAAAAANAALLWATGPAHAAAPRFLTGAALAFVYPPGLKAVSTWFRTDRGTALGVMVGALTLGSALPHLLNGLGGLAWRHVILGTSLLTLAGGALAEWIARDGPYPFPRAVFDVRQAGRVLANRGVRLACLGYFGHMWELYAMWSWFAVFYADRLAENGRVAASREAALAAFAVIGAGSLGCLLAGRMGDRWGRTRTTALAMLLSGACAAVVGLPGLTPEAVLAVGLVWGFWVVADSAQFSTMVTEVAEQQTVGTALTLQLSLGFTLTVATIWLVPIARGAWGWQGALAMLALGPLLGIAAMLRLARLPEARMLAGGKG